LAHLAEHLAVARLRLHVPRVAQRVREPDRARVVKAGDRAQVPGDLPGGPLLELGQAPRELRVPVFQPAEGPLAARAHAHRHRVLRPDVDLERGGGARHGARVYCARDATR
jgi:hypothetical protein